MHKLKETILTRAAYHNQLHQQKAYVRMDHTRAHRFQKIFSLLIYTSMSAHLCADIAFEYEH